MHYTAPVYRPPYEANSLLLEVTTGCSHNACTFCTMYRKVPFSIAPMQQIEEDLQEARAVRSKVRRVFLVNGDPFVLNADKLKAIAERINRVFPEVETISMYASIKNIKDKTDEELRELRALKINELNIGLESALEDVLVRFNKGSDLEDARTQMLRLQKAGIDFSVNMILGGAGKGRSMESARANARLLNEVKPYLIFVATLHIDAGSPLEEDVICERFAECSLGENVEEEIEFIRNLELPNADFYGLHISNLIPVEGKLSPEGKEKILKYLEEELADIPKEMLDSHPQRGPEGRLLRG